MSALYLYVCGLTVATPLQGGGKNSQGSGENVWLASLAICHPLDQNAETASDFASHTQIFILRISNLIQVWIWIVHLQMTVCVPMLKTRLLIQMGIQYTTTIHVS